MKLPRRRRKPPLAARVRPVHWVKLLEIDERGKVRLSRKAALEEREAAEEEA